MEGDKWEKSNTLPHKLSSSNSQTLPSSSSSNAASSLADSPQSRKRFGSASEETILKVCQNICYFIFKTLEMFSCILVKSPRFLFPFTHHNESFNIHVFFF